MAGRGGRSRHGDLLPSSPCTSRQDTKNRLEQKLSVGKVIPSESRAIPKKSPATVTETPHPVDHMDLLPHKSQCWRELPGKDRVLAKLQAMALAGDGLERVVEGLAGDTLVIRRLGLHQELMEAGAFQGGANRSLWNAVKEHWTPVRRPVKREGGKEDGEDIVKGMGRWDEGWA